MSVLEQAQAMMRLQAAAIEVAADRLDGEAFDHAAKLIKNCEGRVVCTGAGVSGVIARKLAATLTSTGTPALFLQPADALHGALGVVTEHDVALCISNSGETDELLVLLPYLERRKVPTIALVGNLESTLAQRSAVALDASVEREACPHDLAPTASTSVVLAIGDALAITVMIQRGITAEEFAFNHPSGRLGRRLTLTVGTLMQSGDKLPTVTVDRSLLDLLSIVGEKGLGAAVVVDERGTLIGLVTDGDIRRAFADLAGGSPLERTVADVMTAQPVTVAPDLLAYDALQLMENRDSQLSVLPVTSDDGLAVGLVRLHDLVGARV